MARRPYTTRFASWAARCRTGWNATATTAAASADSQTLPCSPAAVPTPATTTAYTAVMNSARQPYWSALLITMSMS